MKRVLVTGGSGFIGKHCLRYLIKKDFDIHAISYQNNIDLEEVTWHQLDLLKKDSCIKIIHDIEPSHLLHIGWIAKPRIFWNSYENVLWLKSSIELLDTFGKKGGQRVIGIGTCAEYDSFYGLCSEFKTPLIANTVYGVAKNAMNNSCLTLSKLYGFSFAWCRLFSPYGPGEPKDKLTSLIINSIKNKKIVNCSHGSQIRDFIYISDVAEAIVALLDSDVQGAFNIGTGNPISIHEVILEIISQIGGKEFIKMGILESRENEPKFLVADMQYTQNILDWKPTIQISEGIKNLIEEIMNNS